jgi:hypothetical protein
MKVKEIILEKSGSYQAGKALVSKTTSPSQWGLGGDPDYEAGKSFVSKLVSPSQWFQGGKDVQSGKDVVNKAFTPSRWFQGGDRETKTQSTSSKSTPTDHIDLGNKQPFEIRRNLDNLSSGRYYNQDIAVAKNVS